MTTRSMAAQEGSQGHLELGRMALTAAKERGKGCGKPVPELPAVVDGVPEEEAPEPTREDIAALGDLTDLAGWQVEGGPTREEFCKEQKECPTLEGLRQQGAGEASGDHLIYWENDLLYREPKVPEAGAAHVLLVTQCYRAFLLGLGIPANVTGEEVPALSNPPTEEAHNDDSNFARLDLDDEPGPSGTSGQSVTQAQSHTTTEPAPSGNTTTAPPQHTHTSVPRTCQSAVCSPLQGPQGTPQTQDNQGPGVSGSGHTVQGTEAQDNREAGMTAVCQGEDMPRDPTLQEALTEILGAYQHSHDTLGQIPDNVQENRWLQEGQY
ncbi:hypothetical protein NDU88_004025 [Pleurodeles waltl]|uniref:Uncharacterized protein n=1 Tax=Pleurodeles waltl TaxID=8319 RepID=A0AAV7QEC5_PLEWA|nr:hypothetical protein NDU88_004025 [Pleurodeles waltl]